MTEIKWWKVRNQNLALSAREVGFDLTVYNDYSPGVQKEIRKLAIASALEGFSDDFEDESGREISSITKGVYVICLSDPFTVKYQKSTSQIIYIGQGNVRTRLKQHFEKSLFGFMQSLSGANFDFYICEPKRKGGGKATLYYKHIEHELLARFSETTGGGPREFPLLNRSAGSNKGLDCDKGWDLPLKRSGKRPMWALEPTRFWQFDKLD